MKVAAHHSERRVNYVCEDCTTERGSNQGATERTVRGSVEETLNSLLEAEAEKLTQAGRYDRNEQRQEYRSGHYSRNLMTTAGEVKLQVPRLKGVAFETAIIERYRQRESSVEEFLLGLILTSPSFWNPAR